VATKRDIAVPDRVERLAAAATRDQTPFFVISAQTGEGLEPLMDWVAETLDRTAPVAVALTTS
jgi:50S ribosomal subunit-associated GTPase HflX